MAFSWFQLLYGLRRTGETYEPAIFQIRILIIRIKIDGLLIKLACLSDIFPGKSDVTLEYRNCRSLVVGLSCHLQIGFRLFQLSYIQIGTGHGSHKLHIFLFLPFSSSPAASGSLLRIRLYQTFLLYPPPPAIRAPAFVRLERTCKQHRSQTKYKSTFHVSIHFSYSSLTFTTRTGWVAGTNPDFNIIRCPRSEARKEANPHGSALRGSFNKA